MDTVAHRRAIEEAVLELFTSTTGLPITLFEQREDGDIEVVIAPKARANFPQFCNSMFARPRGHAMCIADMKERARKVFESHSSTLTCCHAGLKNRMVPIVIGGEVRAVLSFGAVHSSGYEHNHQAYEKFNALKAELGLSPDEALGLSREHRSARTLSEHDFARQEQELNKVLRLLYTVLDREERHAMSTENVKHELQMRLQALLPSVEKLDELLPQQVEEAKTQIQHVFGSALAMRTVLHTLTDGQYLEDYRFKAQPLWPLIYASRAVYEPEALRRDIHMEFQVSHATEYIEVSRDQMQLALDNLIYNAVKYSFASGQDRQRYIRITDATDKASYSLTISNYGVGILPDEIQNELIFQDGYRGALTTRESRTGSGKGLAFVKRIVDRHHGRIIVKSDPQALDSTPDESREGKPYLTRVTLVLPYRQPRGG